MRLIFAGTPEPAVESLKRLIDSRHEVVAVLTRPDARKGRGRTLHPSPVKALAMENGIEVLEPTSLKDNDDIRARLRELAPDCIPVVAYGNLIPDDMLDIPQHGWVNLHFSLLPAWRGAAPVQHSILAGDQETGVSVFRIDSGLDTGDVILTEHTAIAPEDTSGALLERLAVGGAEVLKNAMDMLEDGTAEPAPQPKEGTYATKITTEMARVEWTEPADVVDRTVRAFTPAPGAWTTLGGERFKVGPVTMTDADSLSPGAVAVDKKSVRVGTATSDVVLGQVQPPGKKMMNATDWARGLKPEQIANGVVFE